MKRIGLCCCLLFAFLLASAGRTTLPSGHKTEAAFEEYKTEPLYRFRSTKGYLLYKTRDSLPAGLGNGPWKNEGMACHVPTGGAGLKPVYQLFKSDAYGTRFNYTTNKAEADSAKGGVLNSYSGLANWTNQGVVFYVAATQLAGTTPLFKLSRPPSILAAGPDAGKLHPGWDASFLTDDVDDKKIALSQGWKSEGVLGYVWRMPAEAEWLPDLYVPMVSAEEFSVKAIIANQGKANTGGADVYAHLLLYDASGKPVFSDGKFVGGLSPGQTHPVTFDTGKRSLVGLRYQIKVDLSNLVRESNESNNLTDPAEFHRKIKINPDPNGATRVPPPSFVITGVTSTPTQAQPKHTSYQLTVSNSDAYDATWFVSLKNKLPPSPCGPGMTDARMVLQFSVIRNGRPINAGCKPLNGSQQMHILTVETAALLSDSDGVVITLIDRLHGTKYDSTPFTVGWFGLAKTLVPAGCKYFLGRAGSYLCNSEQGMAACENLRKQGKPIECRRVAK